MPTNKTSYFLAQTCNLAPFVWDLSKSAPLRLPCMWHYANLTETSLERVAHKSTEQNEYHKNFQTLWIHKGTKSIVTTFKMGHWVVHSGFRSSDLHIYVFVSVYSRLNQLIVTSLLLIFFYYCWGEKKVEVNTYSVVCRRTADFIKVWRKDTNAYFIHTITMNIYSVPNSTPRCRNSSNSHLPADSLRKGRPQYAQFISFTYFTQTINSLHGTDT